MEVKGTSTTFKYPLSIVYHRLQSLAVNIKILVRLQYGDDGLTTWSRLQISLWLLVNF
jgi:hypothetical protein